MSRKLSVKDLYKVKKTNKLSEKTENRVKTIVKKELRNNSEWKHFTNAYTNTISTAGSVTSVSEVPQGDTDTTRDGDMIQVSSMNYRYSVQSADSENLIRIIFFQWHTSLAVPGVTNVLNIPVGYEELAMYETDQAGHEFKILYDQTHALNAQYSGAVDQRVFIGKVQIPRKKVQYRGGGLNGSNKVYALIISDSVAISHPTIKLVTKLNYMDN